MVPASTVATGYRKVKIPTNIKEMEATFGKLPKGFGFYEDVIGNGQKAYIMFYRPHFGDEEGMSIEGRTEAFKP